jgi:hypothetical protein
MSFNLIISKVKFGQGGGNGGEGVHVTFNDKTSMYWSMLPIEPNKLKFGPFM